MNEDNFILNDEILRQIESKLCPICNLPLKGRLTARRMFLYDRKCRSRLVLLHKDCVKE